MPSICVKKGYVWGCLDGVCMCLVVCKGVWGIPQWGCINTKSIGKMLYQVIMFRYCLFSQCPQMHNNGYVCGCLDGVWMCLGGV